jgi:hypothetical protein
LAHEILRSLAGRADEDDEQAGGERVKRARVADALGVQDAAQFGDDVVRRPFLRFVDEKDTVKVHAYIFPEIAGEINA